MFGLSDEPVLEGTIPDDGIESTQSCFLLLAFHFDLKWSFATGYPVTRLQRRLFGTPATAASSFADGASPPQWICVELAERLLRFARRCINFLYSLWQVDDARPKTLSSELWGASYSADMALWQDKATAIGWGRDR